MACIHCEPDEFIKMASEKNSNVFPRAYVLTCGIAGLVYMFKEGGNLFYLDRFFPTKEKLKDLLQFNFYDIHKDLYRIINLSEVYRSTLM